MTKGSRVAIAVVAVSIVFGGCAIGLFQWANQEKKICLSETLKQQVIIESGRASGHLTRQMLNMETFIRSSQGSDWADGEQSAYAFREAFSEMEKGLDAYSYYLRTSGAEYQRWLKDIRSNYDKYSQLSNRFPADLSELRARQQSMSGMSSNIQLAISQFRHLLDEELAAIVPTLRPKTNSRQTELAERPTDEVDSHPQPPCQPTIDPNQFRRMRERLSSLDEAKSALNRAHELLLLYRSTAEDRNLITEATHYLGEVRRSIDLLRNSSQKTHEIQIAADILKLLEQLDSIVKETDEIKKQLQNTEMGAKALGNSAVRGFDEIVRRLENQKPENIEIRELVISDSSMMVSVSILGIAFLGSLATILWAGLGGNRQIDLKAGNELSNVAPQVETDKIVQTALDLLIGQLRAMVSSLESIRRRINGQ